MGAQTSGINTTNILMQYLKKSTQTQKINEQNINNLKTGPDTTHMAHLTCLPLVPCPDEVDIYWVLTVFQADFLGSATNYPHYSR